MSSSSSSIVPWSIVSGVRSSCDAVETNARRAASWRRSSSCMRASARARSPTSSRRSSCGIVASGPCSVIRSAADRSRPSRRSSVEESAIASSAAIERPTIAANRKRVRTCSTSAAASVSSRSATRTAVIWPWVNSGSATITASPVMRVTGAYCASIATLIAACDGGVNSLS